MEKAATTATTPPLATATTPPLATATTPPLATARAATAKNSKNNGYFQAGLSSEDR